MILWGFRVCGAWKGCCVQLGRGACLYVYKLSQANGAALDETAMSCFAVCCIWIRGLGCCVWMKRSVFPFCFLVLVSQWVVVVYACVDVQVSVCDCMGE